MVNSRIKDTRLPSPASKPEGRKSHPGGAMKASARGHLEYASDVLCCPRCAGNIYINDDIIKCFACGQGYSIESEIPLLFWPNEWEDGRKDVTEIVKAFYEKVPFPNYDDCDSTGSLIDKAKRSVFISLLDEQIPFGTMILEIGCGTGQLTNFLGVANRTVFGTDICLNSLRLAQEFKEKNVIAGSHFLQMNLFRPVFKPETFHLVYCTGVLHHTSDPFAGFQSIARLVRPNGYIVIGLYHRYGRLMHDFRRIIINVCRGRARFLDQRLRKRTKIGKTQRDAWFADQYNHPHESKHTINEIMTWLEQTGFAFVKSIPKARLFESFQSDERLFTPGAPGEWFERMLVDYGMVLTGRKEGGYFIVIGQKKSDSMHV